MSLRTTLWLLIGVVILGGIGLWRGDAGKDSIDPTVVPTLLDGLDGEFHIVRFEVAHSRSREQTSFEARGDDWWLTDPIVDRAGVENVQQLIEIMEANPKLLVERSPSADMLNNLKLEPPVGRVTLYSADGRAHAMRMGDREPTGTHCYIMFEGDDALYRTGANLLNVIERSRQEWRDRRFLLGDGAFARSLEIARPGEPTIVLEKKGTDWLMIEPVQFPAATRRINSLVHGVLRLSVRTFVIAEPSNKQLVEHRLDDQNAVVVRLDLGQGPVEARFGLPVTDGVGAPRSATDSTRRNIVHVEGEVLPLLELREKDLRDPVVCEATISMTQRVRLTRGDGELAFEMEFDPDTKGLRLVAPFRSPIDDTRNGRLRYWFLALRALESIQGDGEVGFLDDADVGPPGIAGAFEEPDAILEIDTVTGTQARRRVRLEFVDDGLNTLVRRANQYPDMAYVVPTAAAEKVLAVDARTFLVRAVMPEDLNDVVGFTIQHGDARDHIQRKKGKAPVWFDPESPDRNTSALQEYLAATLDTEATAFLARDPVPEDGFDPPAAVLRYEMKDDTLFGGEFVLELGARDETGTTVFARSPDIGRRVVFTFPVAMIDELEELFP